jgi:hypothetical protein
MLRVRVFVAEQKLAREAFGITKTRARSIEIRKFANMISLRQLWSWDHQKKKEICTCERGEETRRGPHEEHFDRVIRGEARDVGGTS